MSAKVKELPSSSGDVGGWVFWCPGCNENHLYTADRWQFNGDFECPSFTPSLLYPSKAIRCHLFVTDGRIEYCGDCGHDLAGTTIDMKDWEDDML